MRKLDILFRPLYERRTGYPLGISSFDLHENAFDIKYIEDEVQQQSGSNFLFLLLINEHLDKPQLEDIRKRILDKYSMVGVFGVGGILYPATNIGFTLYVFSNSKPDRVWFGELSQGKRPFKQRPMAHTKTGIIEVPFGVIESYFAEYLGSIDLAIHGGKKDDYSHSSYRLFGVDRSKLEDRTSVDYYKPELIEAEAKLAHEDVVRLGDIADIIGPRELADDSELYTVSLKDAKYPLKSDALRPVRVNARISFVKRNDIITNTFLGNAFLNLTKRPDLVIANTQVIVRVHDRRFSPEYLTAYLNSERMKAYFMRRKRGATIPRLLIKDLLELEVVIPSERTNNSAKDFLSTLGNYDSEKNKLQAINDILFKSKDASSKPLQNELLADLHQQLQSTKNVLIRDLFNADLSEIEKCYKAGAYKGCLALCGSLLEALVLDWLSEVENKDYFTAPDITELRHLISQLHRAEAITVQEQQYANEIRIKRNLIHPKNYIENTPLHKEVCEDVMRKLKPLVQKRYSYRKESGV